MNKDLSLPDNSPAAVIAGAFQTGVVAARNLSRRGVEVALFDCNPKLQGFRSVYGPARLCPDPDKDPARWIEFMRELGEEFGRRAVLIPSSDKYVSAIKENHSVLEGLFAVSPGAMLQGELAQKQTQYRLSMKHDMPMPVTGFVESEEDLIAFADEAAFPCVLKPWHFREWERLAEGNPYLNEKVAVVNSRSDLLAAYRTVSDTTPSVIAQEVILGPDTSKRVYLGYYDRRGRRIANAMFRELRCVPFQFGPASVSEPIVDDEADSVCDSFLHRIGYKGIVEIEVKRDEKDGIVKLIEVNPRLSGGGDAAPYAGVDLAWIHYQEMIGVDPGIIEPSGRRFRHVVLRCDGTAITEYLRAGLLTWKGVLETYRPPIAFFDLDWRDWKIAIETIYVFVTSLLKGLFKREAG